MQAVSYQLQNTGINISSTNDCPISNNGAMQNVTTTNFCHPCYNVYTYVTFWMTRTPAFQLTVVLISSPVALCAVGYDFEAAAAAHAAQSSFREICSKPSNTAHELA